jgi:aconitate hydratase 2/2-methylisocitrate dehydratase
MIRNTRIWQILSQQARAGAKTAVLRNTIVTARKAGSSLLVANGPLARKNGRVLSAQGMSLRWASTFKTNYDGAVAERAQQGIVNKPLDADATSKLVEMLKNPPKGEEAFLMDLLENRVPPGVDEAAYVKAAFLAAVAKGEAKSPIVSAEKATELLATMQGGYNIQPLVDLLDSPTLGAKAADGLSNTLLMFESFYDVEGKAKAGNKNAARVMKSWADAEWFTGKPDVPKKITVTVFKVRIH